MGLSCLPQWTQGYLAPCLCLVLRCYRNSATPSHHRMPLHQTELQQTPWCWQLIQVISDCDPSITFHLVVWKTFVNILLCVTYGKNLFFRPDGKTILSPRPGDPVNDQRWRPLYFVNKPRVPIRTLWSDALLCSHIYDSVYFDNMSSSSLYFFNSLFWDS